MGPAAGAMKCPTDPVHGSLVPLADNERWGWYCPHQEHDGHGERPASRAFFTTAEADERARINRYRERHDL